MSRNKLLARAKAYARREEKMNAQTEYCTESGKICIGTRGEAERVARDIQRAHNGHNVSVYMCNACGCYHVTRLGYEKSKLIRHGKMANRGKLYE